MKKRFLIANYSLMFAVLFSMLFQSFHSFEHITAELSEKKCIHHYQPNKNELTHKHHDLDHCLVCDFSFSSYIPAGVFSFDIDIAHRQIPYFFTSSSIFQSFSGHAAQLRGPPSFIV